MAENLTRRQFMKIAGWAATVTGFTALSIPVIAYFYPKDLAEAPSEPVLVGPPDEIGIGESKTIPFGRYPVLVINTGEGLRAYSAVCTHFACLVNWEPDTGQIRCPCHEGYFDPLDGSVISGPPPLPLETIRIFTGEDGLIYIGGEEEA
nr:Rieske (2Fe-2S) protein [Anaerolineae bacterium]